jgi:telomerase reverse transcriptase
MTDHATPSATVSAFCRAVLCRLIPHEFWGAGEAQVRNKAVFHRNVDRFIGLRRFETLSLHEVSQGIKVSTMKLFT